MNELEEALTNLNKPNIEVDEFKRDLRRSLHLAMAEPQQRSFALPFAIASAAACAFLLALFVLQPQVPARMNAWLTGSETAGSQVAPVRVAENPLPAETHNKMVNASEDRVLKQLLAGGNASEDVDRRYIEDWYRKNAPAQPVEVRSLKGEKFVAIRKFELSSGKQILIWTELGEDNQRHLTTSGKPQTF